ncbi:uncharacterized protein LOC144453560 [Glandiceps talaboti]
MADKAGLKGTSKRSKKGVRSKLSKLFRRKKRYNEFGSSANIVTQCDGKEIDVAELTTEVSENGVKYHNDSNKGNPKSKGGQSLPKVAKKDGNSSGVENERFVDITTVIVEDIPSSDDFPLIDFNVQCEASKSDITEKQLKHNAEYRIDLNVKTSCDTTVTIAPADEKNNCPGVQHLSSKADLGISDDEAVNNDTNSNTQAMSKPDNKNKRSKFGKSKTFRKLKKKLRLSKYKELSESRGNVDVIPRGDDGYEDIKKKKRLQQAGKNVGKAFRTGLQSVLDGYQHVSPFFGYFATTTYSDSTYRKNYNPYNASMRNRPNVIPVFA